MQDPDCIFCKIVNGAIPSRKVFEDEEIFVFHDIRPLAPVHLLMIPKMHRATIYHVTDAAAPALGRIMALKGKHARDHGAEACFRMIGTTGRLGLTEVQHVNVHVIGAPESVTPTTPRKHT